MKKINRTKAVAKNIYFSFITQAVIVFINFLSRTVFIKQLGNNYLGINGLFYNILTLLSLSELGFGNAIIYSLYKPIANNDEKKISAIMNFYGKVYKYIFLIISIIGLSIVPFLKYIINMDEASKFPLNEIKIYYLLFLINSLFSYLYAYKSNLIVANQKAYIVKKYNLVTIIIQFIVQMVILLLFKNYAAYLIVQIICTFGNNISIAKKTEKMYPFITNVEEIEENEKNSICKNVKSIFIYKIATTFVENIDNILISIMVGTAVVGYYSNYHMIVNGVLGVITMFFASFTASVGNLNVEKEELKKEKVFDDIIFLNSFIMSVAATAFIICFEPFINWWIGNEYVLNKYVTLIIILNFYIYGILNPVCVFRDTTGKFKESRNIAIILMFLNLILSIFLGKIWGLFGILFATAISKLFTNVWYQPYILYRDVFKSNVFKYYYRQLKNLLIIAISSFVSWMIIRNINCNNLISLIIKALISISVTTLIFGFLNYKEDSLKNLIERLKFIIMGRNK